jgi:hypothetical protein
MQAEKLRDCRVRAIIVRWGIGNFSQKLKFPNFQISGSARTLISRGRSFKAGGVGTCITDNTLQFYRQYSFLVFVTSDHSAHFEGQYAAHSSFIVLPIFHSLSEPAARVSRATVVSTTTHSFFHQSTAANWRQPRSSLMNRMKA